MLGDDHEMGHGFDPSVCEDCPHLNREADGILASIAQKTAQTLKQDTCGLCGCALKNLNAFKAPPSNCPNLDQHEGR